MNRNNIFIGETPYPITETERIYMNNPLPLPAYGEKAKAREQKTRLPDDFEPSPYSVLIGRGKSCTEATGNKRLRVIVSTFLEEYTNAVDSRIEKSIIVSKIVDMVRDACPQGGFVKQEDGAWFEVSDHVARERVGSMLRDMLHQQYRSSSKSKLERRRRSSVESDGKLPATKKRKSSSKRKEDSSIYNSTAATSSASASLKYSGDELRHVTDHFRSDSHHEVNKSMRGFFHEPFSTTPRTSVAQHRPSYQDMLTRIDGEDVLRRNQQHPNSLQSFPQTQQFPPLDAMTRRTMQHHAAEAAAIAREHEAAQANSSYNNNQHIPQDVLSQQQQLLQLQLQQNRQEQMFLMQQAAQQRRSSLQGAPFEAAAAAAADDDDDASPTALALQDLARQGSTDTI
ncbi:MAG: hypothetical protein SGILL_000912 [Bacillariaceae sp.]